MPRVSLRALVAALVILVAAPAAAHAQIVNVQGLIGEEVAEGLSGQLDASIDWRTGNVQLLHVWGAATARWRRADHLVFAVVRGDYGETGDPLVKYVSKTFEHLRYRWQLADRYAVEAFGQNEADEFRRLRVRALAGAGPRVHVVDGDAVAIRLGVAYMFEYEQLVDDGGALAGEGRIAHRLSTYVTGSVAVTDGVDLVETVYVQPRLDEVADVRVLSESALAVKLREWLVFKTAFVVGHDSRPPPGTKTTDTALQSSVAVKF